MSATGTSDGDTEILGDDSNWWGEDDDHDDPDAAVRPTERDWAVAEPTGDYHDRWAAHVVYHYLRTHGAEVICPECLYERNRAVTLPDPEHYVEACRAEFDGEWRIVYGDHRQHRSCPAPDCGVVTWGGPLSQIETEDLVAAAARILEAVDQKWGIPERRQDELVNNVRRRKVGTNIHDERNLVRMIQNL